MAGRQGDWGRLGGGSGHGEPARERVRGDLSNGRCRAALNSCFVMRRSLPRKRQKMERVAAKLPLLTKRVTQPARERDALSRFRRDLGGAAAEEGDEFGGEFFAEAPHVEKSGSIRVTDTFNAAEVVEQGFATHGAEAGEIVEN